MKAITLIIAALLMVFTLIGAFPLKGFSGEAEQLKKHYNDYISQSIAKNQSKASLQNSRSVKLRICGVLCEQKVVFLTNHRETLVDEMIENQIGTKAYKIDHYLNRRFYKMER